MIKKLSNGEEELHIKDGFMASVCSLFGCEVTVSMNPSTGCKEFKIIGSVKEALSRIAKNEPLGTLDMGKEIKRLAGIPAAQRK